MIPEKNKIAECYLWFSVDEKMVNFVTYKDSRMYSYSILRETSCRTGHQYWDWANYQGND